MSHDPRPAFAAIDALDGDTFVSYLSPDVVFRFGNHDPVKGRQAVKEASEGFWTTIEGLTHHILDIYDDGDTAIAKIDVEYVLKDGRHVTVPNADILKYDGDLISDWQIYIDLAPLFS
jgi:ketosteroid isomerase-like protein